MRTLAIVITCLLAGSIYLVVQYRHADELRAAAKITDRWDDRRGVDRHSTASERAALPALPQRMLQSVCFEEGGDTLGVINGYAVAASWMREKAAENDDRSMLGYVGLVLSAVLGVMGVMVHRRQRHNQLPTSRPEP